MTDQVTVVLVHGFWGGANHWRNVVLDLKKRGFEKIKVLELALKSLKDDAELVQDVVSSIDGDVILVGHSYGGAVITEAGNLPNVKALLYVAGFAPDAGESAGGLSEKTPAKGLVDGVINPDAKGRLWIREDAYGEYFCQDVEQPQSYYMAISQKAPYATTFSDEITEPAWKHKKTYYQRSTEDRMIHPDLQKMMAERMNPTKIYNLETSHASLEAKHQEITDIIAEVISEL